MQRQKAPIYSSTFLPAKLLPMRKPILWGIWQLSGVCVSLTEQNHKNQT